MPRTTRGSALALIATLAAHPALADVVVDPNNTGATEFTNFSGTVVDPLTILASQDLSVGFNPGNSGELLINNLNTQTTLSVFGGLLGYQDGSTGTATVIGSGAAWHNSNAFYAGYGGNGTLRVEDAGILTSSVGYIGTLATSTGAVTITGTNSAWNKSGGDLFVGYTGIGTLNIEDSATVNNRATYIGYNPNSMGTAIVNNSSWTNTSILYVGNAGDGMLNIEAGGTVSNTVSYIGNGGNTTGNVIVTGANSKWTNSGELRIGNSGNGTLNIEAGGAVSNNTVTYIAVGSGSTSNVTVTGANSSWTTNDKILYLGHTGTGTLNIADGGTVSNSIGYIGWNPGSSGTATVTGAGSTWTNSGELRIGNSGNATLNIENGGSVSNNGLAYIATSGGTTGNVTVTGANSSWTTNDNTLYLGYTGTGTLNIEAGGNVSNSIGNIGWNSGSNGIATVTGANSSWTSSGELRVGHFGNAMLNITNSGRVSNADAFIAFTVNSTSTATLSGQGANWANTNLYVGGSDTAAGGNGTLNIGTGSLVTVANTLKVWNTGSLNLLGGTLSIPDAAFDTTASINFVAGTLHFNQDKFFTPTDVANFGVGTLSAGKTLRVDGTALLGAPITLSGGTLSADSGLGFDLINFQAGTLQITSDNLTVNTTFDLGPGKNLFVTNNATIDTQGLLHLRSGSFSANTTTNNGLVQLEGVASLLTGGTIINNSLIAGSGRVSATLNNTATGQVNATNGEKITFLGVGNTNDGTIGVINATVEFNQDATNNATGSITARNAILRFNGGLTNDGTVGLSFGTSDVFGDITNNAGATIAVSGASNATFQDDVVNNGELIVSTGSTAVFFGNVSGSGMFPGGGTVFFEAGFSPGNSPGDVGFGGDLVLGINTGLTIELAGYAQGSEYDHVSIAGNLALDGNLDVRLLGDFTPQYGDTFDLLDFGSLTGSFTDLIFPTLSHGLSFDSSSLLTTGTISVVPEPTTAMALTFLGLTALRRRQRVLI